MEFKTYANVKKKKKVGLKKFNYKNKDGYDLKNTKTTLKKKKIIVTTYFPSSLNLMSGSCSSGGPL